MDHQCSYISIKMFNQGETIYQGHCNATIEEEGRWLNYYELVITSTRLPAHLSNRFMLF